MNDMKKIFALLEESRDLPLEEMNEELKVDNPRVDGNYFKVTINGKEYSYESSQFSPQELLDKFNAIGKHSIGRAVQWVRKNTDNDGIPGGKSYEQKAQERQAALPKAETKIKVEGDSAEILRSFVTQNASEIDNNHDITTFFIDTDAEYAKFNISIPGICLVVRDKRATKASLKREPIVVKFDKSKTLKRYSDWKRGTVPDIDGEVWYTIYVSGKEARANNVKAIREEIENFTYIGYLNEDGDVVISPRVGEAVQVGGQFYVVESVDGSYVSILNEEESKEVAAGSIETETVSLDICESMGTECKGMICVGSYEGREVYSDENDSVFMKD